jgi:hypothetical protein
MEFRHDRLDAWAAVAQDGGFADVFALPDNARAMTMEELEQLIAYHDAMSTRYADAVTRLVAVRDQIEAAMREFGRDVLADPLRTEAAPLRDAWTGAFAEYNWCGRELEAIADYVAPLDDGQE